MAGIIYKATNVKNGKCYIGQTIRSLNARISSHYNECKRRTNKFANALKKYNKEDWEWKIVCNAPPQHLNILERLYIYLFDTYDNGYNSTLGGEFLPASNPEIVKKAGYMSGLARKGKKTGPKSLEVRQKISNALMGRTTKPFSKDHCKNLSISKMGDKNPAKRPDVAKKISIANSGHERNSKIYEIIYPDGHRENIINLSKFCRNNKLNAGNMHSVIRGKRKHCKNYIVKEIK